MTDTRRQLGQWGERIAASHLEEKGYEIVERNWRVARGEIDLIVRGGQELVFVEVKTRRGNKMGSPEEGLTRQKAGKLLALAQEYLYQKDLDVDWRIDLVAVELDRTGKLLRCEHIQNAVLGW
jgi:putative endonuclease